MTLFKSLTFLFTIIFLSSCCCLKHGRKKKISTPIEATVLQVDPRSQNGKTISLKVNDKFDVVFLRECIGCAEMWAITNIDKDKIVQMGSSYKNGPAPGMMGGARDHIFHFTAKDKGVSTLSFTYFKESSIITIDVK